MEYRDLVRHWGAPSLAAEALGLDRRRVDDWKRRRIPTKWQLAAYQASNGRLKLDADARREAREFKAMLQPVASPV